MRWMEDGWIFPYQHKTRIKHLTRDFSYLLLTVDSSPARCNPLSHLHLRVSGLSPSFLATALSICDGPGLSSPSLWFTQSCCFPCLLSLSVKCAAPPSVWSSLSPVCMPHISAGSLATTQALLPVSLPVGPELEPRIDSDNACK